MSDECDSEQSPSREPDAYGQHPAEGSPYAEGASPDGGGERWEPTNSSSWEQEQPSGQGPQGWAPPRPPAVQQPKGAPPCLLYGAIGCGVLILLLVVLGVIGYFGVRSWITGMIETYTDTEPVTLPTVEGTDEEFQQLEDRVERFKTALENNEPVEPLELSEWDLNALIQVDPDWKELRDKIYISIEDNLLKGQVSIPLDLFQFEPAKGRYFNGSAAFDISVRQATPYVYIVDASVKGEPIPDEVMAGLRAKNLAEDWQQDAETRKALRHIDSVEVQDGKLIITPKKVRVHPPSEPVAVQESRRLAPVSGARSFGA